MAVSHGYLQQLGIAASGTPTFKFDFQDADIGVDEEFFDGSGLRGRRSHPIDRVRANTRRIAGTLTLQPTPAELAQVLEWVMGGTPTGSPTVTYPLADTLPSRDVTVDRVGDVYRYSGCKVNRATFRASRGQALQVQLELVGIDETAGVGPFPVLSFDDSGGPFMFHELALVVNSVTVDAEEFELVVDNALNADRFFNRQTLKSIESQDRIVTLNTLIPHGDFTALYGAGGSAGVAATATFTNALNSAVLTFSMVKVALPRRPLEGTGRAEKMIRLNGIAYETAATKELVTTLDPGT